MSLNDIAQRYRRLALSHHPDKGGDPTKFVEISIAYETVKTFHEASRNAFSRLRLNPATAKFADLQKRWEEEKAHPNYAQFQKDYELLYQYLHPAHRAPKNFIRRLFDKTVLRPQNNVFVSVANSMTTGTNNNENNLLEEPKTETKMSNLETIPGDVLA